MHLSFTCSPHYNHTPLPFLLLDSTLGLCVCSSLCKNAKAPYLPISFRHVLKCHLLQEVFPENSIWSAQLSHSPALFFSQNLSLLEILPKVLWNYHCLRWISLQQNKIMRAGIFLSCSSPYPWHLKKCPEQMLKYLLSTWRNTWRWNSSWWYVLIWTGSSFPRAVVGGLITVGRSYTMPLRNLLKTLDPILRKRKMHIHTEFCINLLKPTHGPQVKIPDLRACKGLYAMPHPQSWRLRGKKISKKLQIIPNRFL